MRLLPPLLACTALVLAAALPTPAPATSAFADAPQDRPNIILMMADDLGYGELGSYGQTKIRTPHLDQLAAQGMRFTRFYSGAPVCAPARCVLMTGRHLANAEIRGNKEVKPEGQWPISAELVTLPEMLKSRGYVSGAMGKWGLGPVGSSGDPNDQGFDLFYGYNCQREAHTYYPGHLWHNKEKDMLRNDNVPGHARLKEAPEDYSRFYGEDYAPDKMMEAATGFLREQGARYKRSGEPFFLYLPFVEPHLAMQPPQQWVDQYPEEWDDKPYIGNRGYTPHPRPRAGYAAMISDLDDHVGRVIALVDEMGLGEDTLVIFTSDNGPTHDVGGVDTNFFDSSGGLRGRKGSVYEGGLRVPMIARWPGMIAPKSTSDHVSAFQDVMPTLAEVSGAQPPAGHDGISFLPAMLQNGRQQKHQYLTWEFSGYGGQKAVLMGKWKAVQQRIHKGGSSIALFDLSNDPSESTDVAADHPHVIDKVKFIFRNDRVVNATFPMRLYDQPAIGERMTDAQVAAFADLALRGIVQEYPNKPGPVLSGPQDIRSPREMHPAFYGSFDWHSAVHGHWMLVKLLKDYPQSSVAEQTRQVLARHFTAEIMAAETAYFDAPHNQSFERTYGWAWLLRLALELRTWDDLQGQIWAKNLRPLEERIVELSKAYLPKLTWPIRVGEHANTAWALGEFLDYARGIGDQEFENLVLERARTYYLNDTDYPVKYEPSGHDFFTPALLEADLMRRVLPADEFLTWLDAFLPNMAKNGLGNLAKPVVVSDPTDGKLVHLAGLNLVRAWCMNGVASALPAGDARLKKLQDVAIQHRMAGLDYVFSGHYEGEHWLASFAIYMMTDAGI